MIRQWATSPNFIVNADKTYFDRNGLIFVDSNSRHTEKTPIFAALAREHNARIEATGIRSTWAASTTELSAVAS